MNKAKRDHFLSSTQLNQLSADMSTLSSLARQQWFRYLAAGGISYLIELGTIALLARGLQMSDLASVAIAFWVGFAASFLLQKLYAFDNKSASKRQTAIQILMYTILVIINYIFTLLVVHALSTIVVVEISRTAALIVTTVWNFVLYNHLIFKNND